MPPSREWSQGAQAAALVSQMAVTTVVGGLLGRQLDGVWNTEPWLMITGFVLGFTIGMVALLRTLARTPSTDDHDPTTPP